MLADDVGMDVTRVDIQVSTQSLLEARGVQHGTGAQNVALGQAGHLHGSIRQDVNRVGNDEQNALEAHLANARNNGLEDRDVLVHKVKTGLARLLSGTCGDDDDGGVGGILIIARIDLHGTAERRTMADIESLALGTILVDINQNHLGKQSALHQRERGRRSHKTATDDGDFPVVNHGTPISHGPSCLPGSNRGYLQLHYEPLVGYSSTVCRKDMQLRRLSI